MPSDEKVMQTFLALCAEANRVDSEGMEDPEPSFAAVLHHVKSNPGDRSLFADAFINIVRSPDLSPPELVQYCMHELRWDEVREALSGWLNSESSERVRHVLRKLVAAFYDDWGDAMLYARYSKGSNR